MNEDVTRILGKIKELEQELLNELQNQEHLLSYQFFGKKIAFPDEIIQAHKKYILALWRYLANASLKNIATVPVIWSCVLPAVLMDIFASTYQTICFPVYGIPKVDRNKYITFDRCFLNYLNIVEKINCFFCGYFNGLILYIQEIAARTEQYWCPIKHAHKMSAVHSRYMKFFDYGDAKRYRKGFIEVRKSFEDIT